MKCPICDKGELKENISIKKSFFKTKKIFTYFCPVCSWEKKHEFDMSKEDLDIDILERSNLEKKTKISYDTKREEKNER